MRWMWTVLATVVGLLPAAASADDKEQKEKPLPPGKAAVLRLKGAMEKMKAEGKSDSEIVEALRGMLDRAVAAGREESPAKDPAAVKGPPAVKGPARGKVFPLLAPQGKGEKPKVEKPKIKGPQGEKPQKVKALKAEKQRKIKKLELKQPKMLEQKGPPKVKEAKGAPPASKACPCPCQGKCTCQCQGKCPCAKARPEKKGPGAFWMQKPPWAPRGQGHAWGPRGPRAAWGQSAAAPRHPARGPRGPWFAPGPKGGPRGAMMPPQQQKPSHPKAAPAAGPVAAERMVAAAQKLTEKLRAEGKSPEEIRDALHQLKQRAREALKSAKSARQ